MWHEARKQEKKIRGMLVDYRKRAERRQDFYERIKADPTQFLQVHGRKCKISLDASVATAAENPAIMMPWQGQKENLIDRFDVRAHLDYIPPVPRSEPTDEPTEQADDTERSMNYERFRVLAQNEFLGIVEEKYLHQLHLEEQFGVNAQVEAETKAASAASKKKSAAGAAIGYTYEETDTVVAGSSGTGGSIGSSMVGTSSSSVPFAQSITAIEKSADSAAAAGTSGAASSSARYDECMKDESDSDLDMDVSIDINKIGTAQAHELNACGRQYGMKSNDFYSFLTKDADEADALRMAREEEQEKIMFSGRKSRRERRAQRERKFAGRPLSPPSYAAKEELLPRTLVETNDSSRSPSPINSGKITYITSFGGEDELQAHGKVSFGFSRDMSTLGGIAAGTSKAARLRAEAAGGSAGGGALSYAEKVKQNLEKLKAQQPKESDKKPPVQYQRSAETSRGRRGRGSSRRSSSSGSSRSPPRKSRGRRSSRSSSSSSSNSSSSSSPASRKRGTGSERRPQRSRTEKTGNRSRSPARVAGPSARSGGRHATHSRYRRRSRSSASRSRSVSRSRSRSRTRGRSSRRRSPPGRTRKGHSRRSSSSTSRSSRSRSRTPAGRRQRTPTSRAPGGGDSSDGSHEKPRAPTAGVPQERKVATLPTIVPSPILTVLPPPPPPPLPPASAAVSLSTAASVAVVDEKKPIPSLALIEPEPEVPIKRYYGRRRGDESSSDDSSTSDADRDTNGAAAEERKPAPQPLAVHDPPWGEGDDGTSGTAPAGSSKLASGFTDPMVQIKQEKLDSSTGPITASCGTGASLRFGKTVPGGTSALESKAGIVTGAAPASKPGSSVNPRDRLKRKMQILLNKQYKADKKAEIEKVERQIQQQQERDDEMRELALKLRRRQRELRHKYGTPESDHSKSHSSDGDRSTGDEDEATGGSHVKQQPPRFGHSSTAREGSRSPQRQPLLSSPLASIAAPRLTRPPPSLRVESLSAVPSYRNSAVIERKPVLRSATDSGASAQVPPVTMYSGPGGEVGRLRRRNSPAIGGATGYRTQQSAPVSSHSMSLRRGAGGGVADTGGGGGPGGPGHRPGAPPGPGARFDDRNRRRSPPSRYNRSRSKSRERMPSARDTSTGPGRGRGGRRTEYPGRSRDYDRPHGYAGGGGGGGGGSHSGFSTSSSGGGGGGGGRYRGGRRSRSGSRGRRSRSPGRRSGSPVRGRGNGGGGGALVAGGTSSSKSGSTSAASRQTEPRVVKKLVDY